MQANGYLRLRDENDGDLLDWGTVKQSCTFNKGIQKDGAGLKPSITVTRQHCMF
jgi:hypothetical protein